MSSEAILAMLVSDAQFVVFYLIYAVIADAKPSWKAALICCAIAIAFDRLGAAFSIYSTVTFILNVLGFFLQARFAFRLKGKRCLIVSLECLVCTMALAVLCSSISSFLYGSRNVAETLAADSIRPVYFNLTNIVVLLAFWFIFSSVVRSIREQRLSSPKWLPMARSVILLIGAVAVGVILLHNLDAYEADAKFSRILLTLILTVILFLASFSSLMQEIHTQQLRQWGETLEREKEVSEAIIRDMRVFRHNISNTMHGFRGVIASGDTAEQKAYYEGLARELSRLNNENVVALTHLRYPALQALLLEKVKAAGEAAVPIYLYTRGTPELRGEAGRQFSTVAGILLDNAIEAAADSEAGVVRVEVRQESKELSLSVMNTYPERLDMASFMAGSPPSTKEGHMGIGLSSAEGIIRRNPHMSYVRYRKGRYIESVVAVKAG